MSCEIVTISPYPPGLKVSTIHLLNARSNVCSHPQAAQTRQSLVGQQCTPRVWLIPLGLRRLAA